MVKFLKIPFSLIMATVISILMLSHIAVAEERWSWNDRIFNNYSIKQGLPYGSIPAITEDNTGFIWLVSSEGVMRFDGHSFESVTSQYTLNNNVKLISRDNSGLLWLGTDKGLVSLNPETRRFQSYELLSGQSLAISAIAMDESGESSDAWVATSQGVFKFNTKTFQAEQFLKNHVEADAKLRIFSVLKAKDGTVWVGTNRGLLYKNKSDITFSTFDLTAVLTSSMRISALLQDSHGDIWVGTPRDGVLIIDSKRIISQPALPEFSHEWVYSLAEVLPGVIWIGSFGKGIIQVNVNKGSKSRIRHNRLIESSLGHDEIWTIYKAKNGLVWLGTSKGISLYDAKQKSIKHFFGDSGRNQGISDVNVNSLLEDQQKKIWLGLRDKGVDIIDPFVGQIDHLAVIPEDVEHALPGGAIESMAMHSSGDIYIGSNWGIYRYNQSTLERLNFIGRDTDKYSGTLQMTGDSLWVGGTDGLWRIEIDKSVDVSDNSPLIFPTALNNSRISSMNKTPNEDLIIGTWNGIKWVNSLGELTHQLPVNKVTNIPLINDFISSVSYDNQRRLWVATENSGIYISQNKKYPEKFIQITKAQGLSSNTVRALQMDDRGRVWASSSAGIDIINVDNLSIESLLPQEGSLFAPYFRDARLKASSGEIIFGGSGGITVIDPSHWQPNPHFFPVTITSSKVGDKKDIEAIIGSSKTKPIIIPADQNKFSVEFTTLDFVAVDDLSYRFRLLGLSDSWQVRDSQHRVADFTTLPPGDYQLEIQNTNRLGEWNASSHFIYLNVLPYWYQTFWSKLASLILVSFFALLIIRIRTERLQQQQLSLEEQVKQRTLSLQKVTKELEKLSVTDPLTGMNNRRFLEQNMPAETALGVRRYKSHSGTKERIDSADLVFFLIDIDHFKKINDQYGHKAGDDVLIEVTKRLRLLARESDFLVRWGGEEFLLVVRETSLALAKIMAKRLCQQFKDNRFKIDEETTISITCSIGFAPFPFDISRPETFSWLECIDIADKALYAAKNSGRDAWVGVMGIESLHASVQPDHVVDRIQDKFCLESNLDLSLIESNWQKD